MDKKKYIQLGEIYREHGVKGVCKFFSYSNSDDHLVEDQSYLLRRTDGEEKVVKILNISVFGRYFLIQFDFFHSPEAVIPWRKAALWIDKSLMKKSRGKDLYDYEWEGFVIHDQKKSIVGEILRVEHNPLKQFLVKLDSSQGVRSGEEIYVPCIEDWIVDLDRKKHVVVFELPEGLI